VAALSAANFERLELAAAATPVIIELIGTNTDATFFNPLTVYVDHDESGVAGAFVWFPMASNALAHILATSLALHTSRQQPAAIVSLLSKLPASQVAIKFVDANDAAIKKPRKVILNDILFPILSILFMHRI
jgi:hypothetical protein